MGVFKMGVDALGGGPTKWARFKKFVARILSF